MKNRIRSCPQGHSQTGYEYCRLLSDKNCGFAEGDPERLHIRTLSVLKLRENEPEKCISDLKKMSLQKKSVTLSNSSPEGTGWFNWS